MPMSVAKHGWRILNMMKKMTRKIKQSICKHELKYRSFLQFAVDAVGKIVQNVINIGKQQERNKNEIKY